MLMEHGQIEYNQVQSLVFKIVYCLFWGYYTEIIKGNQTRDSDLQYIREKDDYQQLTVFKNGD